MSKVFFKDIGIKNSSTLKNNRFAVIFLVSTLNCKNSLMFQLEKFQSSLTFVCPSKNLRINSMTVSRPPHSFSTRIQKDIASIIRLDHCVCCVLVFLIGLKIPKKVDHLEGVRFRVRIFSAPTRHFKY